MRPNQVWVSDITYIRTGNDFSYLSLITDAYSHKIVSWALAETLHTKGPLTALNMAVKHLQKGKESLIHHSDRGLQYCCKDYIQQAKAAIVSSIQAYNTLRPHASCDYLTPNLAHQHEGSVKKRWRKYDKKRI